MYRFPRLGAGASVLLFVSSSSLAAQAAPATSAQATAPGAKLITREDIHAWNSIRQTVLSADGKWFAHVVAPNEGNATLVIRGTERGAAETRIPVGEGGGSAAISGDAKWIGYLVAPPYRAPDAGRGRAGRGGGGGGGGRAGNAAAAAEPPAVNKFVIMNLASGEKKEFDRIRRFAFGAETSSWVALQGYPPTSGPSTSEAPAGRGGRGGRGGGGGGATNGGASGSGDGADLLLYNVMTAELFNVGVVDEFAFDESGDWLAYTMDSPNQVGNGVQLRNMKTNAVRAIESEPLVYKHLSWVDSTDVLSVMRGRIPETGIDTVFSIEAFTAMGPGGPANRLLFDPSGRQDFPDGWKIASERAPQFADDMSAVFFGIREVPEEAVAVASTRGATAGAPGAGGTINQTGRGGRGNADGEADPSLILWHAKDPRLQSQQMVQEQQDRSFNYLSEYRFADDRFLRLADDDLRDITITRGEKFAYGTDNQTYQQEASYSGRNYQDIYRVDLATGARQLIMEKKPAIGGMSASPDGRRLLYWGHDGNYWVLDLATRDTINITRGLAASFVDTEDDHNNLYPPATNSLGWTKDGSAVLLNDNWDVWMVPARAGATAVNLTGDGRQNQVRYQRLYDFDAGAGGGGRGGRGGRGGGGGGAGIDVSKPLYFGTYGEWTKKEGLARIDPGKPGAKSLFFDDARYNIIKADAADVYLYTRQTFTEYPDYWVFNPGFKDGYRITDTNPQMKDLAWSSGTRLIDYTSDKGVKLQGALYLPANFEPGKKYPLLVTIYEKRSQNMNSFVSPSETRTPDPTLYTNRGYAVLDPDIVYEVNDPGMSAVWSVVPAVKAAIATGIIDSTRVGLWGHSWGGYQTAFLVTQTNIFTAAIAGAALTDMVSMYSSIYWNTGGTNQAIFEASQGRFKGNFIDNYDAYIRNSPAFHAKNVQTPLILLHNDKDGAVDFNQGITYFNTLRQLDKDVILLEYAGENHGLSRPENQKDYAVRMGEWFNHYLKGDPAPDWMINGVPWLEMGEHLKSRRDSIPRIISD